ncbi:MAG TPA: CAP domain-containing protein [Streptosporangiaceae bacterium]|nr:CAP domain-containing protein [Streptosporangiaceae bacterium]
MPARRSGRHQAIGGDDRGLPVVGLILTGVAVAVLAFVATTATAKFVLTSGDAAVMGRPCPSTAAASPAACPAPAADPDARAAGSALPAGSPASEHPPSGTGAPSAGHAAGTVPSPGGAAAASTSPAAGSEAVQQVLALINQARAQAGLPAYTITAGLSRSAGRHNALMAAGCGLSHQCPGEPSLGARETAAGVTWNAAGENIGEGGPVASSSAAITQLAVALTRSMLDEQPPDDGHRQNILSKKFHHIGIAITRDSHGTVWMTQDFSN